MMCDMKDLHPIQERLLKLLAQNSEEPLTVRELQEELEVSSTSVVAHHMTQLEKKGFLKRNPYNSKDYQVMSAHAPESAVAHLNLYGMAACGPEGSVLDGSPEDRIPISSKLLSFPAFEAFMVKAKGKSMEPRIFEGDFVIARKTQVQENGKVYVCVNDGQALVKKLQIEGKIKILHSFNPSFEPFIAAADFRVEGEVKGLISRRI
jgi:repressor LexA